VRLLDGHSIVSGRFMLSLIIMPLGDAWMLLSTRDWASVLSLAIHARVQRQRTNGRRISCMSDRASDPLLGAYTGWLKKSKLLTQYNSLLFWATLYTCHIGTHRGGCRELYYCNILEWCWWDSSLIWKTNWFPSVLWHCWFGHMTCKNRPRYDL